MQFSRSHQRGMSTLAAVRGAYFLIGCSALCVIAPAAGDDNFISSSVWTWRSTSYELPPWNSRPLRHVEQSHAMPAIVLTSGHKPWPFQQTDSVEDFQTYGPVDSGFMDMLATEIVTGTASFPLPVTQATVHEDASVSSKTIMYSLVPVATSLSSDGFVETSSKVLTTSAFVPVYSRAVESPMVTSLLSGGSMAPVASRQPVALTHPFVFLTNSRSKVASSRRRHSNAGTVNIGSSLMISTHAVEESESKIEVQSHVTVHDISGTLLYSLNPYVSLLTAGGDVSFMATVFDVYTIAASPSDVSLSPASDFRRIAQSHDSLISVSKTAPLPSIITGHNFGMTSELTLLRISSMPQHAPSSQQASLSQHAHLSQHAFSSEHTLLSQYAPLSQHASSVLLSFTMTTPVTAVRILPSHTATMSTSDSHSRQANHTIMSHTATMSTSDSHSRQANHTIMSSITFSVSKPQSQVHASTQGPFNGTAMTSLLLQLQTSQSLPVRTSLMLLLSPSVRLPSTSTSVYTASLAVSPFSVASHQASRLQTSALPSVSDSYTSSLVNTMIRRVSSTATSHQLRSTTVLPLVSPSSGYFYTTPMVLNSTVTSSFSLSPTSSAYNSLSISSLQSSPLSISSSFHTSAVLSTTSPSLLFFSTLSTTSSLHLTMDTIADGFLSRPLLPSPTFPAVGAYPQCNTNEPHQSCDCYMCLNDCCIDSLGKTALHNAVMVAFVRASIEEYQTLEHRFKSVLVRSLAVYCMEAREECFRTGSYSVTNIDLPTDNEFLVSDVIVFRVSQLTTPMPALQLAFAVEIQNNQTAFNASHSGNNTRSNNLQERRRRRRDMSSDIVASGNHYIPEPVLAKVLQRYKKNISLAVGYSILNGSIRSFVSQVSVSVSTLQGILPSPSLVPQPPRSDDNDNTKIIIIVCSVCGGCLLLLVVILVAACCYVKQRKGSFVPMPQGKPVNMMLKQPEDSSYELREIRKSRQSMAWLVLT